MPERQTGALIARRLIGKQFTIPLLAPRMLSVEAPFAGNLTIHGSKREVVSSLQVMQEFSNGVATVVNNLSDLRTIAAAEPQRPSRLTSESGLQYIEDQSNWKIAKSLVEAVDTFAEGHPTKKDSGLEALKAAYEESITATSMAFGQDKLRFSSQGATFDQLQDIIDEEFSPLFPTARQIAFLSMYPEIFAELRRDLII